MTTIMDKQQKWLLRHFHTLCTRLGMTEEEKRALIDGYGVESSKDIDNHDLMDLCHTLELQLNKGAKEADRLRKRVIASIGGWLRLTGKQHTIDTIKSIACRATGYSDFNKIPNERLRNLYNTFRNKQKDMDAAERIAMELLAQSYTTGATSPAILN
ncbi:hypothetical protein [uncultured Alistipes sp.]|uniref:hypothetical protein n=2 Tax=uncultured Alistipes sp. TaxID=538949 RepID=UPI0027298EA5|nr:hypothetical protein [uncultured Alistipes sp.]